MPYLNVKLSVPPSAELSATVARGLTELTSEVLRKRAAVTAVIVDYVAPSHWFIAGQALSSSARPSFYVDIKITDSTNTKDEKALFVARVFALLDGILGGAAPESYVVAHALGADSWGYGGQTQEFRYVSGKSL